MRQFQHFNMQEVNMCIYYITCITLESKQSDTFNVRWTINKNFYGRFSSHIETDRNSNDTAKVFN